MGKDSAIEWTTHTFNPWWGCQRVSAGCEHCYAETWAKRYGHNIWGPAKTTPRRMMSDDYWKQPIKWDKAAQASGVRQRVFCASMADVFEDHPDVAEARVRLFALIDQTPHLDWLLLTKRPENVYSFLRETLHDVSFPPNVWLGTSVENQEQANKRIPHLLAVPAAVRFLSMEPLLGPVDLTEIPVGTDDGLLDALNPPTWEEMVELWRDTTDDWQDEFEEWHGRRIEDASGPMHAGVNWVIAGGESGAGARPPHPDWVRSLRDQCSTAGVPFFFKQWGEWAPHYEKIDDATGDIVLAEIPNGYTCWRVGKKRAGRILDGRVWDEVPAPYDVHA